MKKFIVKTVSIILCATPFLGASPFMIASALATENEVNQSEKYQANAEHLISQERTAKIFLQVEYLEKTKLSDNPDSNDTGVDQYVNINPVNRVFETSTIGADAEIIIVPEGVTEIVGKFESFKYLKQVKLPNTLRKIEKDAFKNCELLEKLDIPDGVKEIGSFSGCKNLKEIKLPNTLTKMDNSVFYNCCTLREIEVPKGVREIGDNAFMYCSSLKKLSIADGTTKIGNSAFAFCDQLEQLIIPESVTEIGDLHFSYCQLKEIKLPVTPKKIGSLSFSNCKKLEKINIPEGVEEIDS